MTLVVGWRQLTDRPKKQTPRHRSPPAAGQLKAGVTQVLRQ